MELFHLKIKIVPVLTSADYKRGFKLNISNLANHKQFQDLIYTQIHLHNRL